MALEMEIVTLIQSVGFPIGVAVWLIIRSSKQDQIIMKNTEALQAVKDAINTCPKKNYIRSVI
jgi:hypothetical protein